MREEIYRIIGMHCASCSIAIQRSLSRIGVEADISLASEEARVRYDPSRVKPSDIIRAIRRAGYDVYREELNAVIKGLRSYDDERILAEKLESMEGVIEVRASHISREISIIYNPLTISRDRIVEYMRSLGYELVEIREEALAEDVGARIALEDLKKLRIYTMVTLPLSLFLALYYMIGVFRPLGLEPFLWDNHFLRDLLIGIPISLVVLVIGSMRFLMPGVRSLLNLTPGMDSLVILGTYSAFLFSLLTTFNIVSGEAFYEASAVVMSFIILGRYIETRLKIRSGEAVRRLAQLQSPMARVLRNGSEEVIPVDRVRVGDLVLIRPGERIPVDGIVKSGRALIDESMITGESEPVARSEGDVVYTGTTVIRGSIVVYATRVGRDTVLGQIIRLVRIAQNSKPRIQRIVDRIAGVFTWIVIAAALATAFYWSLIARAPLDMVVMFTASVLVVACPCALGLATPIALLIGFGRGAELGILIRNAEAIDRAGSVRVIVFDKTGTLTIGKPRVVIVRSLASEISESEIIALAAIAEKRSEHPIALAILEKARELGIDVRDPDFFDSIPGQGVIASVDGKTIAVGSIKLMNGFEISLDEKIESLSRELMDQGLTVVYVAIEGRIIGLIGVGDMPRPESRDVVRYLISKGYRVIMLTGDREITARAVARSLGIKEIFAEVSPEEKAEIIEKIRSSGDSVAMIGDGVNDAASISRATLGIAMGGGSDIAREAGDIILVRNDLRDVIRSIELARAIRRKIYQNLFWAFIYNIILIPVASGAFYGFGIFLRPELAGFAMAMSSISVTLSSQTLRRWNPKTFS
ncbi:MAG: heavy metal translocating P-type ATPase [Sulfolobales archaeon]